jgi:hypothetical protein
MEVEVILTITVGVAATRAAAMREAEVDQDTLDRQSP